MNLFSKLASEGLKAIETLTFKADTVSQATTKNGRTAFKAVASNGKTITFWLKNADDLVEATDDTETEFRLKVGVELGTADVNGFYPLVPGNSKYNAWA